MHTYCQASVRAGRKSSKWQATRERWITHGPIGSLCPFENAKVAVKVETMGDKEPTREVRVPKDAVYAAVFVSLAAVAASAFVWSSVVACRLLAVLVLGHALCRVFLPDGAVPRVRRRRGFGTSRPGAPRLRSPSARICERTGRVRKWAGWLRSVRAAAIDPSAQ